MRGKVRAPGIDMGNAKVPATALMAAATTSAAARSPASAALARERQIGRANRKPERADACGKSQDDKPADKFFADPAYDVFPKKALPLAHRQRRSGARVPSPPRL